MEQVLTYNEIKDRVMSTVPKVCPACGTKLELSPCLQHLKCPNFECSGKFYRKLEIFCKAVGIENIGLKAAEEIVAKLNISKLEEIYSITPEDLLQVGNYKEGMANKVYNSIQKVKKVTWEQFLRGIQLNRVGEGTAKDLSVVIPSLDKLLSITSAELAELLPRATENLTSIIVDSITQNKDEIIKLASILEITYDVAKRPTTNLGINVVVTGSLTSRTRSEFTKFYSENYGVKFVSSVSSTTNILVNNDVNSTSSKNVKAKKLGVKIMTEEEFINYVES